MKLVMMDNTRLYLPVITHLLSRGGNILSGANGGTSYCSTGRNMSVLAGLQEALLPRTAVKNSSGLRVLVVTLWPDPVSADTSNRVGAPSEVGEMKLTQLCRCPLWALLCETGGFFSDEACAERGFGLR